MNRNRFTAIGLGFAMVLTPALALAEEEGVREREVVRVRISPEVALDERAEMKEEEEEDGLIGSALFTPVGAGLLVTGGFKDFVEPVTTDTLTPGGYWDVRGIFGTRSFVGVEAAYHGSAQDVQAIGLQDDAFLISNGVEGAVRLNAPITQAMLPAVDLQAPLLIEPFAFAGLGWQRYSLFNEGDNTSNVENQDDILTVPVGAGLAFAIAGLHLDARVTYRQAFFSELLGGTTSSFADNSLNSWSVGAGLGFEF